MIREERFCWQSKVASDSGNILGHATNALQKPMLPTPDLNWKKAAEGEDRSKEFSLDHCKAEWVLMDWLASTITLKLLLILSLNTFQTLFRYGTEPMSYESPSWVMWHCLHLLLVSFSFLHCLFKLAGLAVPLGFYTNWSEPEKGCLGWIFHQEVDPGHCEASWLQIDWDWVLWKCRSFSRNISLLSSFWESTADFNLANPKISLRPFQCPFRSLLCMAKKKFLKIFFTVALTVLWPNVEKWL